MVVGSQGSAITDRRHHIKMPAIGTERIPTSVKQREQDGEQHEMDLLK